MNRNYAFLTIFILTLAVFSFGQRPGGGPPGGGGRPGMGGQPRGDGPPRGDMQRGGPGQNRVWFEDFDTNKNGSLDAAEFQVAVDTVFANMDRNGNGSLDGDEMRTPRPEGGQPRPDGMGGRGERPQGPPPQARNNNKKMLPPFFFEGRVQPGEPLTKARFEEITRGGFAELDKNHDGALTREEARPPKREGGPGRPGGGPQGPPPPPNAKFIGAELRFGDKVVKEKPFSADIVIEDNRRLYDGSTVTKQVKGAVYRDIAGRTRREQPLDNIGGFNVVGDNAKPQMLVYINDFDAKTQYFLDLGNKIARREQIRDDRGPRPDKEGPPEAKTESLGTKTIEGVTVDGTRTTFEIPAGQLGNEKPIQVVSEKWFSPELQVVVMSRHLDPVAGEHIFKLVNIKRSEPSAELFSIPAGFRIEDKRAPRREE